MSEFWIQTYTGKKFDLLEPTEDMICIEDIAHHLSIENRYNGASKFAYSVAYHSILVCQNCEQKLEGLLHDASEAYIKDLSPRIKDLVSGYRDLEGVITDVIERKFLLTPHYGLIKEIDLRLAKTERLQLLLPTPAPWSDAYENARPFDHIEILNLTPSNVEQLFLKEFEKWRRN